MIRQPVNTELSPIPVLPTNLSHSRFFPSHQRQQSYYHQHHHQQQQQQQQQQHDSKNNFHGKTSCPKQAACDVGSSVQLTTGEGEIQIAVNYISKYFRNRMGDEQTEKFECHLSADLKARFNKHWYPTNPTKGSGYRHVACTGRKGSDGFVMDTSVLRACQAAGLDIDQIIALLPEDMSIWIDPYTVSVRIGKGFVMQIGSIPQPADATAVATTPPDSPLSSSSDADSKCTGENLSSPSWLRANADAYTPLTPPSQRTNVSPSFPTDSVTGGSTELRAHAAPYSPPLIRSVNLQQQQQQQEHQEQQQNYHNQQQHIGTHTHLTNDNTLTRSWNSQYINLAQQHCAFSSNNMNPSPMGIISNTAWGH